MLNFRILYRSITRVCFLITAAALLTSSACIAQRFQWPDNSENLTVLSDSTTGQELRRVMQGFTRALGVRCEYCHVGEAGMPLTEFDFESNYKEAKQKTRVMMRMVNAINGNHIAELTNLEADDHARMSVTCITCHRGRPRPEMLDDVVASTAMTAGVDSAIAQYRVLRDEYYGGFAFDFREGALSEVASRLEEAGRVKDAIKVMNLEREVNGESVRTLVGLASLQSGSGMTTDAISTLERALEIAPDRMKRGVQQQLDALKNE